MSDLAIRVVGQSDATALAGLIAGFRDHLRAKTPSDAELARHLPRSLADPAIEFACAWLSDEAVGFTQTIFVTSIWACGVEAHLEDLFVVPGARGRDVGRALLRHALDRAVARGASRFSLNTNEGNAAAQGLYRSEGLAPQTHALHPGGREVLWTRAIGSAKRSD
jgi:GNAT superfamily N-acetyltransferase